MACRIHQLLLLLALAALSAPGVTSSPADDSVALTRNLPPLKLAIVNQVHFHLEVVAGAMFVLKDFSSEPVHVYLPAKVLQTNWYGFFSWMGNKEGVEFKECKEYDGKSTYDLVWFISPEYHFNFVQSTTAQMKPKVAMYMVHNGHIPDKDFLKLANLSQPTVPLLTLAPHVALNITPRIKSFNDQLPNAEYVLPIYPLVPAKYCFLTDLQGSDHCLKGFSVQGRIESSRRNYTQMWEQMSNHRRNVGRIALEHFRLNILGESVEAFVVPPDVRDMVAVYKNPPYAIFYDIVYHSYGLVPMLASPLYYNSKFSSTVLTSLITGVPMIADKTFMDAYTMIERNAVFFQDEGQNELDVMFQVMQQSFEEMWRIRMSVGDLRDKMNTRARQLITGWLEAAGLQVDPESQAAKRKLLDQRLRRKLLAADETRQLRSAAQTPTWRRLLTGMLDQLRH